MNWQKLDDCFNVKQTSLLSFFIYSNMYPQKHTIYYHVYLHI